MAHGGEANRTSNFLARTCSINLFFTLVFVKSHSFPYTTSTSTMSTSKVPRKRCNHEATSPSRRFPEKRYRTSNFPLPLASGWPLAASTVALATSPPASVSFVGCGRGPLPQPALDFHAFDDAATPCRHSNIGTPSAKQVPQTWAKLHLTRLQPSPRVLKG